jgi:osmotically-inducible protein OsmY
MKAAFGSLFVVGALVAGPVSMHAAASQATAAKSSDKTIDDRIEARIHKDPTLKKYDIDVAVDNGVVTLTGTVPTQADSTKAATLAKVPGTTRVENRIVVDLSARPSGVKGTAGTIKDKTKDGAETVGEKTKAGAEKTKDGAAKGWEKTKDGAAKVGEKTKEGLSKTGEVMTDGWITTRVKSKFLGEDLLKDSDINVDTTDHVVTLRGTVMSAAGKARAAEQAKEVEGVHNVVNNLMIGPKK